MPKRRWPSLCEPPGRDGTLIGVAVPWVSAFFRVASWVSAFFRVASVGSPAAAARAVVPRRSPSPRRTALPTRSDTGRRHQRLLSGPLRPVHVHRPEVRASRNRAPASNPVLPRGLHERARRSASRAVGASAAMAARPGTSAFADHSGARWSRPVARTARSRGSGSPGCGARASCASSAENAVRASFSSSQLITGGYEEAEADVDAMPEEASLDGAPVGAPLGQRVLQPERTGTLLRPRRLRAVESAECQAACRKVAAWTPDGVRPLCLSRVATSLCQAEGVGEAVGAGPPPGAPSPALVALGSTAIVM